MYLGHALASKSGTQLVVNYVEKLFLVNGMNGGTVEMVDRSISDSFNNSRFNGNIAIQGDGNIQTQSKMEEFEKSFSALVEQIKAIQDESKRESALYLADDLKEAFIKQDKGKAEKIFKLLNGLIGATSSLATIATFFGLSF